MQGEIGKTVGYRAELGTTDIAEYEVEDGRVETVGGGWSADGVFIFSVEYWVVEGARCAYWVSVLVISILIFNDTNKQTDD